ncbi:MAG: hypothetical protein DIZ80_06435 [endosymbiont of Galathealinum brachiosum]|uniref:Glycosyltransferase family 4 protein n=1 Tax=endosymbiont of Galathealinum brachiosum TaxID=2200906 RepID=A0A370DFW0_9GAMM|nr:MAG: hypothetical protein DIZ80_06435 [endosymbiont of Galathealinum brachiosum]
MKVLLVTNLFPTPVDLERGVFTLQLAKELNKICDLTIVCPLPWFPKIKMLRFLDKWYQLANVPEKYEIDGLTVYSPKYFLLPKVSESFHDVLMGMRLEPFIKALHNKQKIDVINSHWLYPDSVAVDRVAKKINVKHIATGLGCDINDSLTQRSKADKILKMLQNIGGVTVVSSRLKQVLVSNGIKEDNIKVILNGVDVNKFKLLDSDINRKKLNLDKSSKIILYVGRLSFEKSIDSLINAFHKIHHTNIELLLVIIGDGPELGFLHEIVESLGLNKVVKFIGKVSHDEINSWFSSADIFCLPSLREGCPNVVLESLSSGCPVVASDVGALPDLITKDSGLLFEPKNIDDISNKLTLALNHKWNRKLIHDSMKSFTWEEVASQYFQVYYDE